VPRKGREGEGAGRHHKMVKTNASKTATKGAGAALALGWTSGPCIRRPSPHNTTPHPDAPTPTVVRLHRTLKGGTTPCGYVLLPGSRSMATSRPDSSGTNRAPSRAATRLALEPNGPNPGSTSCVSGPCPTGPTMSLRLLPASLKRKWGHGSPRVPAAPSSSRRRDGVWATKRGLSGVDWENPAPRTPPPRSFPAGHPCGPPKAVHLGALAAAIMATRSSQRLGPRTALTEPMPEPKPLGGYSSRRCKIIMVLFSGCGFGARSAPVGCLAGQGDQGRVSGCYSLDLVRLASQVVHARGVTH
jgi:hypothetical protein